MQTSPHVPVVHRASPRSSGLGSGSRAYDGLGLLSLEDLLYFGPSQFQWAWILTNLNLLDAEPDLRLDSR